jgi:hypothetical protein
VAAAVALSPSYRPFTVAFISGASSESPPPPPCFGVLGPNNQPRDLSIQQPLSAATNKKPLSS